MQVKPERQANIALNRSCASRGDPSTLDQQVVVPVVAVDQVAFSRDVAQQRGDVAPQPAKEAVVDERLGQQVLAGGTGGSAGVNMVANDLRVASPLPFQPKTGGLADVGVAKGVERLENRRECRQAIGERQRVMRDPWGPPGDGEGVPLVEATLVLTVDMAPQPRG